MSLATGNGLPSTPPNTALASRHEQRRDRQRPGSGSQRMAIGLTGEPVPPATRRGPIVKRNS